MPLPTHTQVLVVGAGPTGLACALTLVGLGLQVTIVDASPNNRSDCRAVVVHARTLEVLETIGLAKPLLDAGIHAKGATFHAGTSKLMEVNIRQLSNETEFAVVLLIPQHDVERILREKLAELGVQVLRPHAVVDMKQDASSAGLEVTFDDGSTIRSHYVVGADGSRSTIRRLSNIDFKDPVTGVGYDGDIPPASTYQIALADVYFDEPLPSLVPRDSISFHLDKFFLLCPLPTGDDAREKNLSRWRIVIASPPGGQAPPRNPDIAWLQAELNDRCAWAIKPRIASVVSASRYRARAAVANTFFRKFGAGNVLLVGDAAHVHSPAGGQGMNLGLCDAVALGHAIGAHIDNSNTMSAESQEASDAPLSVYSTSRRKIAFKVVGMSGGITALVNVGTGWRRIVRNAMFWIMGRAPFLGRAIAWRVSGLGNRDA